MLILVLVWVFWALTQMPNMPSEREVFLKKDRGTFLEMLRLCSNQSVAKSGPAGPGTNPDLTGMAEI